MKTPKEWWAEEHSTKPGPSRIRVTFSRELTEAEREFLLRLGQKITKDTGDRFRFSRDNRLYLESNTADSRQLYDGVASVFAYSFVNVFPTAVRTFRELVKPAIRIVKQDAVVETAERLPEEFKQDTGHVRWGDIRKDVASGLMDTITNTAASNVSVEYITEVANKKRTKKGKKRE